jgi:putative aldouronate transport system permease protein
MVRSKATKVIDLAIALVCFIVVLICLLPMVNILARSLSSPLAIVNREVSFLPVNPTLESYQYVFKDPSFSRSMIWTGILTAIVTLFSLFITILCAYPLTYDNLKGKKIINTIIIFTMYFSGGIIPSYILMSQLKLLNTSWVMIVGSVSI